MSDQQNGTGTGPEVLSDAEAWLRLPRGALPALRRIAELLAAGHTGVIELTTHRGGVRQLRVTELWTPPRRIAPDLTPPRVPPPP